MHPRIPILISLLTFTVIYSLPVTAQDQTAEDAEEESLSLFDGDAETNKSGWSQFTVSAGYVWMEADGRFEIELPNNTIPVLDFDRLGVDDTDGSYTASLKWRSKNSNWGAWMGYWRFSGAGFRVWEDELILEDDVVVPVGAGVATELSTNWYIVEATYSFLQNERWDAGIGFGFHIVDLDTTLAVAGQVGEEQRVETVTKIDTLAPLPNVVGYLHYRLGDRWDLTGRYGWFGLSYDEYDGEMTNLIALARYNINERWALEGGYQFVKLDVDVEERGYTSVYDMDFSGPMAMVRFNF